MKQNTIAVLVLVSTLTAQEAPPTVPPGNVLQAALTRMLALRSVAFDCRLQETQSAAMPFGNQPQHSQLSGVIDAERGTQVAIGTGEHEMLLVRDRCVVRRAGGAWVLRRGVLADGEPMPFVPDLLALCTVLVPVADQATRPRGADQGSDKVVLDLKIDGKAARELMWSGGLPSPAADLDRLVLGLSLPGVEVAAPKVRYELSFTVDRDTQLIQTVVVRGWKEPGDAGGVGVEFELANPRRCAQARLDRARARQGQGRGPAAVDRDEARAARLRHRAPAGARRGRHPAALADGQQAGAVRPLWAERRRGSGVGSGISRPSGSAWPAATANEADVGAAPTSIDPACWVARAMPRSGAAWLERGRRRCCFWVASPAAAANRIFAPREEPRQEKLTA